MKEQKMDINQTLKKVQEDYLYEARNLITKNYPDWKSSKLDSVLRRIEKLSDHIDTLPYK